MRLFIASNLSPEVTDDLNLRVAKLKPRLPPASWVRPDTQHVTFAFLGEQPQSLISDITPKLRVAMASIRRFEASLAGCGFFPNARRARVGWVGLKPEPLFRVIADAVRQIVTTAGVELDRAEFRAHLTLLRLRDPWPPASTHLFETTLQGYNSPPYMLDRVTLYASELHPSGAIHTPVEAFDLSA